MGKKKFKIKKECEFMPLIKVRGIGEEQMMKVSTIMIDKLTEAVKCPRDYYENGEHF